MTECANGGSQPWRGYMAAVEGGEVIGFGGYKIMYDSQKAIIIREECGGSTVGRRAPRVARGCARSIAPTTVARLPSH